MLSQLILSPGLPDFVLQNAAAKSREFEATYGKHKNPPENISNHSAVEQMVVLIQKLNSVVANLRCQEFPESISGLIDLQQESRILCEIDSR